MSNLETKQTNPVRLLVLCGLFTALIAVCTLIGFPIAAGQGYLNPGDALIHAAVFVIGGWQCALVAGLGSMLTDLMLGYTVFLPGTFIIKACMALVGMLLLKRCKHSFTAFAIAGIVVPFGYFCYEALLSLFKVWSIAVAVYDLPWNFVQYVFGVVLGSVIVSVLKRVNRSVGLF